MGISQERLQEISEEIADYVVKKARLAEQGISGTRVYGENGIHIEVTVQPVREWLRKQSER
jgi:hypothetical protein